MWLFEGVVILISLCVIFIVFILWLICCSGSGALFRCFWLFVRPWPVLFDPSSCWLALPQLHTIYVVYGVIGSCIGKIKNVDDGDQLGELLL